ncbi:hypothetical protein MRX96_053361 [Rhipicephalus microplus]
MALRRMQKSKGLHLNFPEKNGPTQGHISPSSTIRENIDFRKRTALVSVNMVIMLISVTVLWYTLYSYMFRPSQPYKVWTSLITKSFVFTFLLHLDVFLMVASGFFADVKFVSSLRENILLRQAYQVFIGSFATVLMVKESVKESESRSALYFSACCPEERYEEAVVRRLWARLQELPGLRAPDGLSAGVITLLRFLH